MVWGEVRLPNDSMPSQIHAAEIIIDVFASYIRCTYKITTVTQWKSLNFEQPDQIGIETIIFVLHRTSRRLKS